jgi:hypothetical protein
VSGLCARLPAGECRRQSDCFTAGDRCVSDRCVGCQTTGAACTGALEACDAATNTCRVCTSNAECSPGLVCTADGCAECASNADCAPYPNRPTCVFEAYEGAAPTAGRCQECVGTAPNTCGASAGCATYGEFCSAWGSCASDADCSGATPRCYAIPGGMPSCARCAVDAHCPAGQGCRFGECHVFPQGDRCKEPIPLTLASPRTDLAVSLAGTSWEDPMEWGVHDAYFRFTLTEPTRLVIDGRSAGAWFDGTLRLYSDGCAGLVGRHSIGVLSYNPPYTTYYPAWTVYLPAGTWVLALQGAAKPEYVLSIEKTPATLAAGQACWNPIPIVQSPAGSSVTGSTDGLLATSGDVCSADPWDWTARTAVYALDLAAPSYVSLTATPLDPALWLDLDVKDSCAVTEPRTCTGAANEAVTRTFSPMPAGLHYVVVDAEKNTNGSYRLDAVVTPWSMNDLCADAKPLTFDAGGVAVDAGTVAPNTSTPSGCVCSNALCGNDVYYAFTTMADQKLTVSATGDGSWRPSLAIRRACDATPVEACALAPSAANPAATTVDVLPAGSWLVQVGSPSGAGGHFDLQVLLSGPVRPTNDVCVDAIPLASGTQVAGDTRGAADDVSGACGYTATGVGKDVVYTFTAPSRGLFHPIATPTTAALRPVLRARADCATTTDLACNVASGAGSAVWLTSLYLQPGNTVVTWVDGFDGTAGPFTLDPGFEPAPANDQCTGATVLGTSTLTSSLLTSFTDGSCAGAEQNDVFFRVDVSARSTVTVTVHPDSWVRPAIAYYGVTCDGLCDTKVIGSVTGGDVSLSASYNAGPGYFAVSSADGSAGSFQVSATVR